MINFTLLPRHSAWGGGVLVPHMYPFAGKGASACSELGHVSPCPWVTCVGPSPIHMCDACETLDTCGTHVSVLCAKAWSCVCS